jgi:hypothetical protein
MINQQRELFRTALLRILDANHTRFGLTVQALCHLMPVFGFFKSKPDEAEKEIAYLEDKGYIALVTKPISPENAAWRITAAGRDFLAEVNGE